jgi:hypothetical protein
MKQLKDVSLICHAKCDIIKLIFEKHGLMATIIGRNIVIVQQRVYCSKLNTVTSQNHVFDETEEAVIHCLSEIYVLVC